MTLISSKVNVGDTATASQYNNLREDVVIFGGDYAVTTNSTNAYALTVDSQFILQAGVVVKCKINAGNTGAPTLNVTPSGGAATGAKNVLKPTLVALAAGDFITNQVCYLMYDGTQWILLSLPGQPNDSLNVDSVVGENINGTTTPVPVYMSDGTNSRTSGRVYQSDANDSTNEARNFFGFIRDNVSTGAAVNVKRGVVSGFSGLTIGAYYWVTDTVGTISSTHGTAEICVGMAISATQIDTLQRPTGMSFIQQNTVTKPAKVGGTTTDTSPAIARFALIVELNTFQRSVFIAKIGITDASFYEVETNGSNSGVGFLASWSGNTITITNRSLAGSSNDMNDLFINYYR